MTVLYQALQRHREGCRMAYTQTTWSDRNVQKPLTYSFTDNGDGTYTLVPAEGTIINAGTALNATNMNKIETGIGTVDKQVAIYQYKNIGGAL